MKHIFGPVPSRRLGISLGIDPIPIKVCSFDCIYCEVAGTTLKTLKRDEYIPMKEIMEELETWLAGSKFEPDFITFSGSGEPTLHSRIGEMIRKIKNNTNINVAVITNGSTLNMTDVRKELLPADVVMPSLDTAIPKTFRKLNRPHLDISLEQLIQGLIQFRREYNGKYWLETLVVRNVNDNEQEYRALAETIATIDPDQVHLNTVARPSGSSNAQPVDRAELEKLQNMIGPKAKIVFNFTSQVKTKNSDEIANALYELLKIRACTIEDMARSVGISPAEVESHINAFAKKGTVESIQFQGKTFFKIPADREIDENK